MSIFNCLKNLKFLLEFQFVMTLKNLWSNWCLPGSNTNDVIGMLSYHLWNEQGPVVQN